MNHRIGAVLYFIWGLLHLNAARMVFALGETLGPGIVQGRLYQSAWNLAVFAAISIVVAIWLNWRNSRLGYWINLTAVSATDLGFIAFLLVPGYVPWVPGGLGPLLWVAGVFFATIGLRKEDTTP